MLMKKSKKILIALISVIAVIAAVIAGLNALAVNSLVKFGNTYDKVEYENQLTAETDENGSFFFTTDGEFRVMHLTDIHIGGGFLSKSDDEKALNAVAAMVTKEKPDTSFTIDKYNYYSDRYDLKGFTREDVTMQFENVTVIPDELRK